LTIAELREIATVFLSQPRTEQSPHHLGMEHKYVF